MFACVYFEEDNTISVIRKGHRDLKCEKFSPNERCVMKWGNAEFEGIIIEVSGKFLIMILPKLQKLDLVPSRIFLRNFSGCKRPPLYHLS